MLGSAVLFVIDLYLSLPQASNAEITRELNVKHTLSNIDWVGSRLKSPSLASVGTEIPSCEVKAKLDAHARLNTLLSESAKNSARSGGDFDIQLGDLGRSH